MKVMIFASISFGLAIDDVTDPGTHFFSPSPTP
jgi:hypothetical protein